MSCGEIAEGIGMSREGVRKIEQGALKKLRRHLGKNSRTTLQELLDTHRPNEK